MDEAVAETLFVAVTFAALLWVESRYRLAKLRLGTAMLSLLVLMAAQPNYTSVVRRISGEPRAERVTKLHGSPLSDYESGVLTMYNAVSEQSDLYAMVRLVSFGVLVWLACSPVLRGANCSSRQVAPKESGPVP